MSHFPVAVLATNLLKYVSVVFIQHKEHMLYSNRRPSSFIYSLSDNQFKGNNMTQYSILLLTWVFQPLYEMLCMKVLMLLVINNYSTQPVCLIPQKGGKKKEIIRSWLLPCRMKIWAELNWAIWPRIFPNIILSMV